MSNAHQVLAAAMGNAAPDELPTVDEYVGTADIEQVAREPQVPPTVVWAQAASVACGLAAALIIVWLIGVLWRARQRMRPRRAAVPLEHHRQRELERLAAQEN